jgi:hypothetical protein
MSDCEDLDRQVISFPVRAGNAFAVEGMYPPALAGAELRTRSVAVHTEGSDKFKVAGLDKAEANQNIGRPVRWTEPCTNRQRFATASYVRGVPCSPQCWQCYDGHPVNLRGDIPVATRAVVTIVDNTGTHVIPVAACYTPDCNDGDERRCYGWLFNGTNCGDCSHVFPSDPAGVDLARWRGYELFNCANCMPGEKDIYYSVEAGIDCFINDPTEPCNREYYLWVHVFITPRIYLGCPPIYSCIEDTFDGPLCYDPPQPPPDIDRCTSYRGCVKLDNYEELCGVVKKTLTLRCAHPSDVEGNCENTCTVLATFSGKPDTGPYCVRCWGTEDNPLTCPDGVTQGTPRLGVSIAKSLKLVVSHYGASDVVPGVCCQTLIEGTELVLESCTQTDGCVIDTDSECEPCFIPAEATLIARWRDAPRSFVVEDAECGEMTLIISAQADIYCWLSGVGAVTPCYGVRVSVCIATSIDSEDECCSEAGTAHCMHYVGCAELTPQEQCGANGRFWDTGDPVTVVLTCAEDPNCAPCQLHVVLTTNENL